MMWVVGGFLVIWFGVAYLRPFGTGVAGRMMAKMPVPALSVDGRWILYGRAWNRVAGVRQALQVEGGDAGDLFLNRVFASLEREGRMRSVLRERHLGVSREDIEGQMRAWIEQAGGEEAFRDLTERTYGWNLAQFRRQVARPYVEAKQVEEAVWKDRVLQKEKREKIEEAYAAWQSGATFSGLVLDYSEDATSVFNGDVGWMTEDQVPPAWMGPARFLDVGEVSPVLEEEDRFVMLRVDKRQEADEVLGTPWRVNLSVLVVNKVSVDEVLREEGGSAKIWVRL